MILLTFSCRWPVRLFVAQLRVAASREAEGVVGLVNSPSAGATIRRLSAQWIEFAQGLGLLAGGDLFR